MEALEAILTRRSVRRFSDKPVGEELVGKILEAAVAAPSARNEQPWHFIVVRDREKLAKMGEVNQHARMAAGAALAIIVCGDTSNLPKGPEYVVQDCCNAAMNVLLACHALGLGAVWTAAYPNEERVAGVRKLFGIPDNVVPLCVIPIGYPAETPIGHPRQLEGRIHPEKWQAGG